MLGNWRKSLTSAPLGPEADILGEIMASEPDLELSFASSLDEQTFTETAGSLRESGARVDLRRRSPEGPYAFLELLIPTAVILFVLKPYVQAF
jgi:hypothetical protein